MVYFPLNLKRELTAWHISKALPKIHHDNIIFQKLLYLFMLLWISNFSDAVSDWSSSIFFLSTRLYTRCWVLSLLIQKKKLLNIRKCEKILKQNCVSDWYHGVKGIKRRELSLKSFLKKHFRAFLKEINLSYCGFISHIQFSLFLCFSVSVCKLSYYL